MKASLKHIFSFIATMIAIPLFAVIPEDCESERNKYDYPTHYCECTHEFLPFALPLDVRITDTVWYKASLNQLSDGLSAYLHSDGDVSFDVYQNCTSKNIRYQAVFEKNQTNSVNSQTIQDKLEQEGIVGNAIFRICIAPRNGTGGRVICTSQKQGFTSSCDDPLYLFPGMKIATHTTKNTYIINPAEIENITDFLLLWEEENHSTAQLQITRNACDGELVADVELVDMNTPYTLSAQQIQEAKDNGEYFYLHLTHTSSFGHLHCIAKEYTHIITEVALCQGRELVLQDTILTESTYYIYDTIQTSISTFDVYVYNLVIETPEIQYDTLCLKSTQLPFIYKQQIISEFRDYEFLLSYENDCDEYIALHVQHHIDTLRHAIDSTICFGGTFKRGDKIHKSDITFVDTVAINQDTISITTLNVLFDKEPTIYYDTLALKSTELSKPYRYRLPNGNAETITAFGQYKFTYENPPCQEQLLLYVHHQIDTIYQMVDTTLCANTSFLYNDTLLITSDTAFVDSIWLNQDALYLADIKVHFAIDQLQYDTLYLKTTDFPYLYRKQQLVTLDQLNTELDVYIQFNNVCDEHYRLYICHRVDTIYPVIDTTICQGRIYDYSQSLHILSDTSFVDSCFLNADTFQIISVHAQFSAPELRYDTLQLKKADVPYLYFDQLTITDFGDYEFILQRPDLCDEYIRLHVMHQIDTIYATMDTTICQGKTFSHDGKVYTSNTTLCTEEWLNEDTYQITTINLMFAAPEWQHDTLYLKTADLPYSYQEQQTITDFGDYNFILHRDGSCDEQILLHVSHKIDTIYTVLDTTICQGKTFLHDGKTYTSNTILYANDWLNDDTYHITTIHLSFTTPELQRDTLYLKTTDLPYTYREYFTIPADGLNQEHEFKLNIPDACNEHYLIYAKHHVDTIYQIVDSILCYGTYSYEYEGKYYTKEQSFAKYIQVNPDTLLVDIHNFYIDTEPSVIYDTLTLEVSQFPYEYPLPDYSELIINNYGEYEQEYENYETWCVEIILLTVKPEDSNITTSVSNLPVTKRAQLVMQEGRVYIILGNNRFTLLGERIQ